MPDAQHNNLTYDNYLMHYGVKGMKWGVRNDKRLEGVPRKTNREAKKDAKEYARAKMFYGEGAGTRRKLINNSVEAKRKRDPAYKQAFDYHLENQDLSKHAQKARSERHRKDAVNSTKKTVRGIKNLAMGTGAAVTTTATAGYYAYQIYKNNPAVHNAVNRAANAPVNKIKNFNTSNNVKKWAKANGFG